MDQVCEDVEVPILLVPEPVGTCEGAELGGAEEEEPPDVHGELNQFREQWHNELKADQGRMSALQCGNGGDVEAQARQYFLIGTQLEQQGALYEAIEYYRRAMHMVPDIEMRMEFCCTRSPRDRQESESSVDSNIDMEEEGEADLTTKFENLRVVERSLCRPAYPQRACHISALPVEVLIYIFKWVVSSQLDMKTLENLAEVCRGFYLCARDEELWRLACIRVWGSNPGKVKKYGSWRNMFIEKPHLQFVGCYISKMSYIRQGEKGLDNFYKPWHHIEYFRYIRFFSEGSVFMMTSPEDPLLTLPKLRSPSSKIPGMLKGYYRVSGNKVTGMLKRVQATETITGGYYKTKRIKNQVNQNENQQTFRIEMEVVNVGKKNGFKLTWKQYSVGTYRGGEDNFSDFELTNKAYPPLLFSRVKSYSMSVDDLLY